MASTEWEIELENCIYDLIDGTLLDWDVSQEKTHEICVDNETGRELIKTINRVVYNVGER